MADHRILMITPTFFPDPMVAAVRATQFARYLGRLGWSVKVVTRHYGYDADRAILDEQISDNVEIHYLNRFAGRPPATQIDTSRRTTPDRRALTKLAQLAYIPDTSIRFWRSHREQIQSVFRAFDPHLFMTTTPPVSVHSVGLWLKAISQCPWVADWREAFLADPRYRPKGLRKLRWRALKKLEAKVYCEADLHLFQLPMHERWARLKHPVVRGKSMLLINGVTDTASDDGDGVTTCEGRRAFRRILTVGTLAPEAKKILPEVVAKLVEDGVSVQYTHLGAAATHLVEAAERMPQHVRVPGYVSHQETMAHISASDVLVNWLSQKRQGGLIISTKLIEFLSSGNQILEINPTSSNRRILRRYGGGMTLECPSFEEVYETLRTLLTRDRTVEARDVDAFRAEWHWSRKADRLNQKLCSLLARRGLS